MTAHATQSPLGWDAFVQQSMVLEVAGREAPLDAPFDVLDALPQSELPRMDDVPHDTLMTAVLMPGALDADAIVALRDAPACHADAPDMVYACVLSTDEFGQQVIDLHAVGLGTLRQHRDASGNVRVRLHWRGQEWPVLAMERGAGVGKSLASLANAIDADVREGKGKAIAAVLRRYVSAAIQQIDVRPDMMHEVLTLAYSLLMRARLGLSPGMRTPQHQALTRRMWARCIATVQARADAVMRHGALVLPSVAGQLGTLFVPGRTDTAVRRLMRDALSIDVPSRRVTTDGIVSAAQVVVSPHMPARASEAMYAEVVDMNPTLWPHIGPENDVQALYMEVLVHRLSAPNLMRVLGHVALIHERGGVELEGDELPDRLRCEVMELTGCSSRRANKVQRATYMKCGHIVRHWQWMVEQHSTHGGKGKGRPVRRPERVPLLVTTSLEAASDRAVRMAVNPLVLVGGHTMLIPRALFAVTDDMDRDGSMRKFGVGIVSRLMLSAKDHNRLRKGEALSKALERYMLLGKFDEVYARDGASGAQRWLDGLLDRLRDIGHANLIGDTRVEWGKGKRWRDDATLQYGSEQPGWMRKRPPALPPASVPSTPISTP